MNILLDSTYLFPALDVEITEGWTKSDLKNLLQSPSDAFFYVDLSLFEIYTKVMKLILQGQLALEITSVQRGIQGIVNSPKLHKINWWENLYESDIVLKLKGIHNDSIDCMILYIAVVNCELLATYDETLIEKIKDNEDVRDFVQGMNPKFKIWLNDLSDDSFILFPEND